RLYVPCLLCSVSFVFSSRRRHTRSKRDWSSDVCSSDLVGLTQSAASTAVILLMPWAVWAVAAASVALGVLASYPLDRFVSPEAAVRVAKVLALLGAVQLLVVALL